MTDGTRIETGKEREIRKYDRLSSLLFKGEALAMGIGLTLFSGGVMLGHVNTSRNPYKELPNVTQYLAIEAGLRSINESKFTLKEIAEKNPELLDNSLIETYINRRREELSLLEKQPEFTDYQSWKKSNVYSYFKLTGLGAGLGIGSALLACGGLWAVDKKRKKILERQEGKQHGP